MGDRVKNENFITIQGWMINELQLKGNELIIYALIYGFSQAENQVFNGSLQYLAEWTNSTKQGVIKNLKSLIEKGFVGKNEKFINGVKFCEYYATKFNGVLNKVEQGGKQSLMGGIKQSLPNNIVSNNINNTINNNNNKKTDENVPYEKIKNLYHEICVSYPKLIKLSDNRKTAIAARFKEYNYNIEIFRTLFMKAEDSEFLKGKTTSWKADFDWLMNQSNMTKVLEDRYKNEENKNEGNNKHNSNECGEEFAQFG